MAAITTHHHGLERGRTGTHGPARKDSAGGPLRGPTCATGSRRPPNLTRAPREPLLDSVRRLGARVARVLPVRLRPCPCVPW